MTSLPLQTTGLSQMSSFLFLCRASQLLPLIHWSPC
uniref:RDR1 n=1 Tax=Arundo donax TaxID=35708 RepID=A0A0A8YPR8_ARUDO